MKILGAVILAIVLLYVVVKLYLAIAYSHVNSGLRFRGWLISLFTSYDSEEGLRRFAGLAGTLMPILFHYQSVGLDVKKVSIPGQDGNTVPAVIYKSKDTQPNATGLLWIHGGGYCIGTPGAEKNFLNPLITLTNTIAVVPDYRLSVQEPYPAAFHDCCDTLLWMKEHAVELGIDDRQLFVGGCSAGGGLTAAVALYARDSGTVNIAFQMPIYPMLNDKMDTSSMIGNSELLWDEKRNRAAWKVYLGALSGKENVPRYAAPARETDFSDLPPAYTFVGTLDPFYDETLQYVEALRECGIEVKCDVYEAAFHGFDVIPSGISRAARARFLTEYKYAAAHYYAPQD